MNKYKIIIIIIFLIVSLTLGKVHAVVRNINLLGKTIVLDAGHGGIDSGAVSSNIIEKDMNLIIVKELERELVNRGATVYLTRDSDKDLSTTKVHRKRSDLYNRAKYINKINPDIFLSIHLNSTQNSNWRGIQVFYTNKNNENKIIANILTKDLSSKICNVRDSKEYNKYYMYNKIKAPGVLIETGFISNKDDNYQLRQRKFRSKLVYIIANSLESYLVN